MTTIKACSSYQFDTFYLDVRARQLWQGRNELELPRKVFDCLLYLIEHRDRAVKHDELLEAIWGNIPLSDHVIAQAVFEARRALGDTGAERRYIKTLRGFGYHWVAPVQCVTETPTANTAKVRRRWLAATIGALLLAVVSAALFLQPGNMSPGNTNTTTADVSELMLVLPVTVEADDEHHAWVRLGAMDLVAGRLLAAGQVVMPSDAVITAVRGLPDEPGPAHLQALSALTGAKLILDGRAQLVRDRWRFSLRTVHGGEYPLKSQAEADDILEAARMAADRMALSLGHSPAPEPSAEPGLTSLLQQSLAALLAQQHEIASDLIAAAEPELRDHPEVRLHMARIELHRHNLTAAHEILLALRSEVAVLNDPELHAWVLLALGWVHLYRGDPDGAEPLLNQAVDLLESRTAPAIKARLHSTLGVVALDRGDIHGARAHFAHQRVALHSSGDASRMAFLDNRMGLLEAMRERYSEALGHFERSARRFAALHDIGAELGQRANVIYIQLGLLNPPAAIATASRVDALLPQAGDPEIIAWATLTRAYLLHTIGQQTAAEELLADVLAATTDNEHLRLLYWRALLLQAEIAAAAGNFDLVARLGVELFTAIPHAYAPMAEERGRAGLIATRAQLALDQSMAAAATANALAAWATGTASPAPAVYAALAQAEVAASTNKSQQAQAAYERALALADANHVPLRVLQVAASYTRWLLSSAKQREANLEQALVVSSRVVEYADRHYDAALLQLGVTHATGSTSAWHTALSRVRSLAGERSLPPEWTTPPLSAQSVQSGN